MRRIVLFLLIAIAVPQFTFGQTSDSQTLQALLTEVRGLHQDLKASLGRLQSAQILLTRLNLQQQSVTRAMQRFDEARTKLEDARSRQRDTSATVKRFEDQLSAEQSPDHARDLRLILSQLKSQMDSATEV